MSKAHMPPVPPANRSKQGPVTGSSSDDAAAEAEARRRAERNTAEQGQQGNARQNTTNQGYQQDR